jgi:hypothetical protein
LATSSLLKAVLLSVKEGGSLPIRGAAISAGRTSKDESQSRRERHLVSLHARLRAMVIRIADPESDSEQLTHANADSALDAELETGSIAQILQEVELLLPVTS